MKGGGGKDGSGPKMASKNIDSRLRNFRHFVSQVIDGSRKAPAAQQSKILRHPEVEFNVLNLKLRGWSGWKQVLDLNPTTFWFLRNKIGFKIKKLKPKYNVVSLECMLKTITIGSCCEKQYHILGKIMQIHFGWSKNRDYFHIFLSHFACMSPC